MDRESWALSDFDLECMIENTNRCGRKLFFIKNEQKYELSRRWAWDEKRIRLFFDFKKIFIYVLIFLGSKIDSIASMSI